MLTRADLSPLQNDAIDAIQQRRKLAVWSKPGSGKTVMALTAVEDMFLERTLIIGTKRIVEHVWRQEAKLWGHLSHIHMDLLTGSPAKREAMLRESTARYLLINYELIPWLLDTLKRDLSMFEGIIFDELSKMKAPGAKRFKKMRLALPQVPVRIGLTGTPRSNSMMGLWSQTYCTNGPVLGETFTHFKTRYFFPVDQRRVIWVPYADTEERLRNKMKPYAYVTPPEAASPEAKINLVPVGLPPVAKKLYETLERDLTADHNGAEITAIEPPQLRNKLIQLAGGAIYHGLEKEWVHVHDAKLDALSDLADELQGDQLLIFFRYRHELERIQKRIKDVVGIDKVDDWLKGKYQNLCVHPACLASDTLVLTEKSGWKRIVDVTSSEKVFDGVEFVSHDGCQFSGHREVVDVDGVRMTPDHKILVNNQWREARDVRDSGDIGRAILSKTRRGATEASQGEVPELQYSGHSPLAERRQIQPIRTTFLQNMLPRNPAWIIRKQDIQDMEAHDRKMYQSFISRIQTLWGPGYSLLRQMAQFFEFLCGYGSVVSGPPNNREGGQLKRVQYFKLSMGHERRATGKQTVKPRSEDRTGKCSFSGVLQTEQRDQRWGNPLLESNERRRGNGNGDVPEFDIPAREEVPVYDLMNCGPRTRFVIKTPNGNQMIVHNSAAHGLNLHVGGASQACWFSLPESQELWEQGNRRLARKGQKKQAISHVLFAVNTKEEQVADALKSHGRLQDLLMETVYGQDDHSGDTVA